MLAVVDGGRKVTVLDAANEVVRCIDLKDVCTATVIVHGNNLIVEDDFTKTIRVIDMDAPEKVRTIGTPGVHLGDDQEPGGLFGSFTLAVFAPWADEEAHTLLVADIWAERISEFNVMSGEFIRWIHHAELSYPSGIALWTPQTGGSSSVFASSMGDPHRICMFDHSSGALVRSFGQGHVRTPGHMVVSPGKGDDQDFLLLVVDRGASRVVAFGLDCLPVRVFDGTIHPTGIAQRGGEVIVGVPDAECLHVFDLHTGTFIRTIDGVRLPLGMHVFWPKDEYILK